MKDTVYCTVVVPYSVLPSNRSLKTSLAVKIIAARVQTQDWAHACIGRRTSYCTRVPHSRSAAVVPLHDPEDQRSRTGFD